MNYLTNLAARSAQKPEDIPKAAEKTYSFDIHPNQIYLTRKSTLTLNMSPEKNQTNKQPDNRLRTLLLKLIQWTSGEAYKPGHTNNNTNTHKKRANNRRRHKRKDSKAREGDVVYRFHNVQGLGDKNTFAPFTWNGLKQHVMCWQ